MKSKYRNRIYWVPDGPKIRAVAAGLLLAFSLACQGSKTATVYGDGATERELRSLANPVDQVFSLADGSKVAVTGTIGKVCPKGCWFYVLGDESIMYVDLSAKDLIIPTTSTKQKVWIKGIIRGSGADRALEASMVLIEP